MTLFVGRRLPRQNAGWLVLWLYAHLPIALAVAAAGAGDRLGPPSALAARDAAQHDPDRDLVLCVRTNCADDTCRAGTRLGHGRGRTAARIESSSGTSLCERRLGEVTVDELHRHRALTYGGGASLGRARADVTSGEDAGNTGLERVLGSRSSAREDEAVIVACDRVVEPIGARLRRRGRETRTRTAGARRS